MISSVQNNVIPNKMNTNFQRNYSSSNNGRKFGVGLASFVVPGLGQVINGETPRGLAFFLGSMCSGLIFFRKSKRSIAGWLCRMGIGIWAAIDAAKRS